MAVLVERHSSWKNDAHDVTAAVNYLPPEIEEVKPEDTEKYIVKKFGQWINSSRYMTIHNVRGHEDDFDLDKNGFHFAALTKKERDVSNDEIIKETYFPELEELVKKILGAQHVFTWNHVLRRTENTFYLEAPDTERYNRFSTCAPHSDFAVYDPDLMLSEEYRQKVNSTLSAEQLDRVKNCKRWAIVQSWKPLKTLHRDPLAVADAATLKQEDWRWRQTSDPNIGYSMLTHESQGPERHNWYYMHEMQPHEVLFFKGFDSKRGEDVDFKGFVGAHTAIVLPESEGQPPRESIETRMYVAWD